MKVHEYQAKQIFREYGVPVPKGSVAFTPEEAVGLAEDMGYPCVIKAQVHGGSRPATVGANERVRGGTADRRKRSDAGWATGSRSAQYDLRRWGTRPRGRTGGKGAPES